MNNHIEHALTFATQGDADNVFQIPLDLQNGPLNILSANVYLSAVAGSPTAVTLDIDLTDGTLTQSVIAAGAIGTAAGQTRLTPDDPDGEDRFLLHDTGDDWRLEVDFNFTGGSTPTVTGTLVLRYAH